VSFDGEVGMLVGIDPPVRGAVHVLNTIFRGLTVLDDGVEGFAHDSLGKPTIAGQARHA